MSQENVEFLEGLFARAADMDKQALLDALPDLIAQTGEGSVGACVINSTSSSAWHV